MGKGTKISFDVLTSSDDSIFEQQDTTSNKKLLKGNTPRKHGLDALKRKQSTAKRLQQQATSSSLPKHKLQIAALSDQNAALARSNETLRAMVCAKDNDLLAFNRETFELREYIVRIEENDKYLEDEIRHLKQQLAQQQNDFCTQLYALNGYLNKMKTITSNYFESNGRRMTGDHYYETHGHNASSFRQQQYQRESGVSRRPSSTTPNTSSRSTQLIDYGNDYLPHVNILKEMVSGAAVANPKRRRSSRTIIQKEGSTRPTEADLEEGEEEEQQENGQYEEGVEDEEEEEDVEEQNESNLDESGNETTTTTSDRCRTADSVYDFDENAEREIEEKIQEQVNRDAMREEACQQNALLALGPICEEDEEEEEDDDSDEDIEEAEDGHEDEELTDREETGDENASEAIEEDEDADENVEEDNQHVEEEEENDDEEELDIKAEPVNDIDVELVEQQQQEDGDDARNGEVNFDPIDETCEEQDPGNDLKNNHEANDKSHKRASTDKQTTASPSKNPRVSQTESINDGSHTPQTGSIASPKAVEIEAKQTASPKPQIATQPPATETIQVGDVKRMSGRRKKSSVRLASDLVVQRSVAHDRRRSQLFHTNEEPVTVAADDKESEIEIYTDTKNEPINAEAVPPPAVAQSTRAIQPQQILKQHVLFFKSKVTFKSDQPQAGINEQSRPPLPPLPPTARRKVNFTNDEKEKENETFGYVADEQTKAKQKRQAKKQQLSELSNSIEGGSNGTDSAGSATNSSGNGFSVLSVNNSINTSQTSRSQDSMSRFLLTEPDDTSNESVGGLSLSQGSNADTDSGRVKRSKSKVSYKELSLNAYVDLF